MNPASGAPKQGSRWGNLFQQAVAGVESRLDTILAPDDERGEHSACQPGALDNAEQSPRDDGPPFFTTYENKATRGNFNVSLGDQRNDRLQARLARAVAAKNSRAFGPESSPSLSSVTSRAASPSIPRENLINDTEETHRNEPQPWLSETVTFGNKDSQPSPDDVENSLHHVGDSSIQVPIPKTSIQLPASSALSRQVPGMGASNIPQKPENMEQESDLPGASPSVHAVMSSFSSTSNQTEHLYNLPEDYDAIIARMRGDYESLKLEQQEESVRYQERIDALQSKLQYLAKESAQSARLTADSAPPGSLNRKLAESEERIALLLEEGQKLSIAEFRYLSTIKKLRAKIAEREKHISEEHLKLDQAERRARDAAEAARRAENAERRALERLKRNPTTEKAIDELKIERDGALSTLADVKAQLTDAMAQLKHTESREENSEQLKAERELISQLREDVERLRAEKEKNDRKLTTEIDELKARLQEQKTMASSKEFELRHEQTSCQSRRSLLQCQWRRSSESLPPNRNTPDSIRRCW
ncbi:hypothetical protein L228DRAFT_9689 [Xylona heveae TC161]|uniref:Uncharacterized protein n=1 Tax=Xylona heveae (strain CBS 132557 / TC161) TaxID=1328760 RepID=A0A165JJ13_XYLHT|nr:hypothetical protein L228DRAFT_9689 [Xylona heveae TC161]KZF26305.1 hypothetical protein L228DRAFT_9689 [Xylona heveae TC161]